jgi:hypothetical protein
MFIHVIDASFIFISNEDIPFNNFRSVKLFKNLSILAWIFAE